MTQIQYVKRTPVKPDFPADDQAPGAAWYQFGAFWIAAIGQPIQADVDAYLGVDAAGQAAAARVAADAADTATCQQDPTVLAFLNMSPADLDAWVAQNITGAPIALTQLKTNAGVAITVLGKLALVAARGRRLR